MIRQYQELPAFKDPQGWAMATAVMHESGIVELEAESTKLDQSLTRTRAVLRTLRALMLNTENYRIDDVIELIEVATDALEGHGDDPLSFVEDFKHKASQAVYDQVAVRRVAPAAVAAECVPDREAMRLALADALVSVISEHVQAGPEGVERTAAKPNRKAKKSAPKNAEREAQ
jgi:hypothetical protein